MSYSSSTTNEVQSCRSALSHRNRQAQRSPTNSIASSDSAYCSSRDGSPISFGVQTYPPSYLSRFGVTSPTTSVRSSDSAYCRSRVSSPLSFGVQTDWSSDIGGFRVTSPTSSMGSSDSGIGSSIELTSTHLGKLNVGSLASNFLHVGAIVRDQRHLNIVAKLWNQSVPFTPKGIPKPKRLNMNFYMNELWTYQSYDTFFFEKVTLETLLRTFSARQIGNNICLARLLMIAYTIKPMVYNYSKKRIIGMSSFGMHSLCCFSHGGRVTFHLGPAHEMITDFIFNGSRKQLKRRFSSHGLNDATAPAHAPEKSVGIFGNISRKTHGLNLAVGGHHLPNLFADGMIKDQGQHGHLCIVNKAPHLLVGVENSGTRQTSVLNGSYHGLSCTPKDLSAFMLPKFSHEKMSRFFDDIPCSKTNGLHVMLRKKDLENIKKIITLSNLELINELVRIIRSDLAKMQRR